MTKRCVKCGDEINIAMTNRGRMQSVNPGYIHVSVRGDILGDLYGVVGDDGEIHVGNISAAGFEDETHIHRGRRLHSETCSERLVKPKEEPI